MKKNSREPKYPCKNVVSKIYENQFGGEWWAEWKFHPTRKWRFDYARPDLKIAIEIDGGVFTGGRHSGGIGQVKDWEKLNEAAVMGWCVLHTTPDETFAQSLRELVLRATKSRENAEK